MNVTYLSEGGCLNINSMLAVSASISIRGDSSEGNIQQPCSVAIDINSGQ